MCDITLPFAASLSDLASHALDATIRLIHENVPWLDWIGIGHRIVHGGDRYRMPVRLDDAVIAGIEACIPLAPQHLPAGLQAIRWLQQRHPQTPQVACFDTCFHTDLAPAETWCAVPRAWRAQGVRRYGFHGLAYESVMSQLPPSARQERVLLAHLGSGASLCAVLHGRSIATTMGFSALDGLPMGTRCGSIDAGAVLHLLRQPGMTLSSVERMLSDRSGLLGVSGLSSDMRDLLAAEATHAEAAEAVDLFRHCVVREASALIGLMQGVDRIAFSGGIGEHAPTIRQRIADGLGWLGVRLEPRWNAISTRQISPPDSAMAVHVIPADEQRVIATHVGRLLGELG